MTELSKLYRRYLRVASHTPRSAPQEERELFRRWRASGGHLQEQEVPLLARALQRTPRRWFACKVCRVLESSPPALFNPLIRTGLSEPEHFIPLCVRLFGVVRVNDELLRYLSDEQTVVMAASALYYAEELPLVWSDAAADYIPDLKLMKAVYPRSVEHGVTVVHNVYPDREAVHRKRYEMMLRTIIASRNDEVRRRLGDLLGSRPDVVDEELRELERHAWECMKRT